MTQVGILSGLRIIEIDQSDTSVCCTGMLAEHGAEVIKIQAPDDTNTPHPHDRAKKSVVLDLAQSQGGAVLGDLIARAHIVVGTSDCPALNAAAWRTKNPSLICGIFDASTTTENVADRAQRMAFGLIAARMRAADTGQGQIVRVPADETAGQGAPTVSFSDTSIPALADAPLLGADTDMYLSEAPEPDMSDADKRSLRDIFGHFATGVTVVTTRQDDGTPRGFTANSFTSVSLDPPLALVCLAKTAHSCDTFLSAPHFAVNILTEDQKTASGIFASRTPDKFDQVAWHNGAAGMPLLDGTLASLVCKSERCVDAGDHVILLGRVIDHASVEASPLGYFRGKYFSVGLEDALVDAAALSGAVQIGAVLSRGQQVLLKADEKGGLSVPKLTGKTQNLPALKAHLSKQGIDAQLDFLYSVFIDNSTGHQRIYYQGTAVGFAPAQHKFYPLEKIPFDDVTQPAERSMLQRFCAEFSHGSFGIYQGDDAQGIVHRVAHHGP